VSGSEWIAVQDRLPEDGEQVLAWTKYGIDIATRDDLYGVTPRQWHHIGGPPFLAEVTHWMPLPPAPEAEEVQP